MLSSNMRGFPGDFKISGSAIRVPGKVQAVRPGHGLGAVCSAVSLLGYFARCYQLKAWQFEGKFRVSPAR